jgi:ADP-L-glycero-D-manno-heptose 6-epimerase
MNKVAKILLTLMHFPNLSEWQGFKFLMYTANEYQKERMASVAFHSFNQFKAQGPVKLFKGHLTGDEDGMQLRDFVYVKGEVAVHL